MIGTQNNVKPEIRSPTVTEYRGKPVVRHELIRDELVRQFRFIFNISLGLEMATTPDGLDACLWADMNNRETLRVPNVEKAGWRLCIAVVHSNSRRQKTAFYGGIKSPQGILLFDKIPFKPREDKLEETLEKTVSRWGLFVDRYWDKYKELRDFKLESDEYRRLLIECGRDGVLSWSRMGKFDDERNDHETALNFLLRLSKHVGRQPILSHEPARSQCWSLHAGYVKVHSLRN